jgi:hypothetical protein
MIAGDPLRCGERDGARLDGDVNFGVIELARSIGEVGGNLDGSLLGFEEAGQAESEESQRQEGAADDH